MLRKKKIDHNSQDELLVTNKPIQKVINYAI